MELIETEQTEQTDTQNPFSSDFGYNDSGNADIFVAHNKGRVLYCPSRNSTGWFVWDGQRWAPDALRMVTAYAREVMEEMLKYAADHLCHAAKNEDRAEANAMLAWARNSLNHFRITHMLAQASAGTTLCVDGSVLDAHPELLNLKNGTLNLTTWEFYPACKEDRLTQVTDVSYVPEAVCPRWRKFLDEVTESNVEVQKYLQRVAGYLLTGEQSEQAFFLIAGAGGTGKSTFWRTLQGMLGDYFTVASRGLFVVNSGQRVYAEGASPATAALAGKRVVATAELQDGVRFNEVLLKMITGGESITARKLNEHPFTFQPQCKPIFLTNHIPHTSDFSGAMGQRIRLVKFERVFRGTANEVQDLHKTFIQEHAGILQWALQGLKEVQAHGLQEPVEIKNNVTEYMHEENVVARWLDDCTTLASLEDEVSASEAFNSFQQWACRSNEFGKAKSQKWFSARLKDLDFESRHTMAGSVYKGLRIKVSVAAVTVGGQSVLTETRATDDERILNHVVAHVTRELPNMTFEPETPPAPTENDCILLPTVTRVAAWFQRNYLRTVETHDIHLQAMEKGYRIELVPSEMTEAL